MARRQTAEFVLRPFEGLPGEPDWVALREVVPAATGTARTTAEHGAREVVVTTLLPSGWPALHRGDGVVMLALQSVGATDDLSRELAALLLEAIEAPEGTAVSRTGTAGPGPRLQDVLDLTVPFEVTVHEGFEYWTAAGVERTPELDAALERMNQTVIPTDRLTSVAAAYRARMGDKDFLRWAQPHEEDVFIDALARLHARRESGLGEGGALGRFIGAFRSCGLLVPVWDLDRSASLADLDAATAALGERLDAALAVTEPLDATERRARAGLVARQLTLR